MKIIKEKRTVKISKNFFVCAVGRYFFSYYHTAFWGFVIQVSSLLRIKLFPVKKKKQRDKGMCDEVAYIFIVCF
jgi:hypothetical protein